MLQEKPPFIVKLWPGINDEIKRKLAKNIAGSVAEELNIDIGDVSVAIEEIPREERGEKVYKAEIKNNPHLYHKPDYEYK